MAKRKLINNHSLFKKAESVLVGGVDSPVRSFKYVGLEPILIKKGLGSKVYDYDANVYIDYVLSWGALILGHAHPQIIKDLSRKIQKGLSFGTTNKSEVELAEVIVQAIPFVDKLRLVNSGTEAVMSAIRLARGYTKRDKILKFENSYHGHADYLLAKAGSGLATLQIPQSAGIPQDFIKHTLTAAGGNMALLEKIFKKYGSQIAAVIFEPAGGNFGVVAPDITFLKGLEWLAEKYKTLLIADEIITGFRFHFGSLCGKLAITPDLICLGKIIGGGLPIGAYAGKKEVMDLLAPLGNVYQASTFSGNPIVTQAGLSTLQALYKLRNAYHSLEDRVSYLSRLIEKEAKSEGVNLAVKNFGSMFSIKFKDKNDFKKFYKELLAQGVYFAPSEYEVNFLSFAHSKKDIEKTAQAIRFALHNIN